jgi:thymidylate synthase ThyX
MIEAQVICDSAGEHSPRLTTFLVQFPAFVEQELLRHRSFSFSSSSSRAVPVAKMLAEVRSDELRAAPVWWGREQKGMASGDELSDSWEHESKVFSHGYSSAHHTIPPRLGAELAWKRAALDAASHAEYSHYCGAHKSIVNRILGPFVHRRIVVTTCEPGLMNFFGLRLGKAAQPEIRVLAEKMWAAWNESEPKKLAPGEWHLPFIDRDSIADMLQYKGTHQNQIEREWGIPKYDNKATVLRMSQRVSAARCARTSYLSFDTGKRSMIEEDLALADRLIAQGHWSPLEHQATPDELHYNNHLAGMWQHQSEAGNLGLGWRQFRKMYPGEAVAPLPEEYR